ncbi:MFS transporter [Mucilaginibacter sabulilitoris]|uniref:MFS transporter n=1 Tax=Mucilaginibacter sabulilitoris TaxID=1173583 RepID=A0ABZ0TXY0_9SPHI|nr:MFS transporter [Mucilaginibacter sabulilitoris]WPU96933.1 MFS transporter [Mucilaginibacter sabulilitoris]
MKRSIYIMALGAFGIVTTELGVIGILPDLSKQFNVSIDAAGWLISGFALTVALTGPFTNMLTAKINRKTIMCLVLVMFALSNLVSAVAPNFTILMIARILPAFLHPVFWAVAVTAAAKQTGPKDAPKAVAIVMAGLSLATVLGIPLTTYIANVFNWRISFVVSSVINLLAFAALALFSPSMPIAPEQPGSKSLLKILRNVNLWIKLLAATLVLAGMFASYGYLAEYLEKVTNMTGTQISILLLVFGSTGIAGNWFIGIALSKNVRVTVRLFLIALIVTHGLAYQFGGDFIPMVIILSVWGFIHTGGFLVASIQLTHNLPDTSLDFVNSLMPSCFNAGITLGSLLGGFAIVHYGIHQVIWITVSLLSITLMLSFISGTGKTPINRDILIEKDVESYSL